MDLRIHFLGTASAGPTLKRSHPSIAILRGNELLLFDCGEGTQRQMGAAGLGFGRAMKIFVSHLHGDHVIGLLGLLQTMSLTGREKPLELYGPRGIKGFIEHNARFLNFHLDFPLSVTTISEGVVAEGNEYVIKASRGIHSVPSFAYLLEERKRPGIFYPHKAETLGIPKGRLWSLLQRGQAIEVRGETVKPEDVLGPSRPGRKIGISGDTRPTPQLAEFFGDVDVLIFEATYGSDHAAKAAETLHSTASEAAQLAREARARLLVLTHFSARYHDTRMLVQEARKIFPKVIAARDLMTLVVPYRN